MTIVGVPIRISDGRTCDTYAVSTPMRVSNTMPRAAQSSPAGTRGRGPVRGSTRVLTMPTVGAIEKLYRILDITREGKLTPAEFAYVRAGFFPGAAKAYEDLLKRIGKPTKATLVQRTEIGDDRIHVYELAFPTGTFIARLGLAPDGRVSVFSMGPKR